jgi:hypothetical protein
MVKILCDSSKLLLLSTLQTRVSSQYFVIVRFVKKITLVPNFLHKLNSLAYLTGKNGENVNVYLTLT